MPLVRGASYAGFGYVPSNTVVGGQQNNQNLLQEGISFAESLWSNLTAGAARDATRENRAKVLMGLANAGSVLAAQVCLAGPDNVASHETAYWTAAQQAIQSQRPDVWAAAVAAGPWWPVGQPFDMIAVRQQIGAQLAAAGITVNQAALSQPFSTSAIPVTVTTTGGGTFVAPGQTGTNGTTPVVTGTPPLQAGMSPLVMLALIGVGVWFITKKPRPL